ncbi:MAG TPA: hypothetical protein VJ765_14455 [Chitinophagaceae bacterium]|nr:hypothetical protein [Chitinophagaceae bacterium]
MSTDLEKFISQNRNDFDNASPSDNVWEHIERSIQVKKPARLNDFSHSGREARRFTIRDIYKWSAAAAIFFITLTSIYFMVTKKNSDSYRDEIPTAKDEIEKHSPRLDNFNSVAIEFAAEFKEATKAVEDRQQELKSAIANNPELYRKFQDDLKILDSSYRLLREQANQSVNRDVIIKAMIHNLQLQSELLGRQLMIIHEFKTTKTSKDEKNI